MNIPAQTYMMNRYYRLLQNFYIFPISLFFYIFTLSPSIVPGDSASFCVEVFSHRLSFGQPDAHPLFLLFGRIFAILPFDLAYALNLESAFFGAITVFLVFQLTLAITHSRRAALLSALTCMVSHAFWFHAVIGEVYTLHSLFVVLLVSICLYNFPKKHMYTAFFIVFILGIFNHFILFITLPAFICFWFIKATPKLRRQILVIVGICAASGIVLCIGTYTISPQTFKGLLRKTIFNNSSNIIYLLPPQSPKAFFDELTFYFLYLIYQFPIGGFFFIPLGMAVLMRKNRSAATLILLVIICNALFFIKTTMWHSFGGTKVTFYIADYVLYSLFFGIGSNAILDMVLLKKGSSPGFLHQRVWSEIIIPVLPAILTIAVYGAMPRVVDALSIDLIKARPLALRNNNRFFLNPSKINYTGGEQLGKQLLSMALPGSIIFADYTIATVLRYFQIVKNFHKDVTVKTVDESDTITTMIKQLYCEEKHPIFYTADTISYYNFSGLRQHATITKESPLYRIVPDTAICIDYFAP